MVELVIKIEQNQNDISVKKNQVLNVLVRVSEIFVTLVNIAILVAFTVTCIIMYRAVPRVKGGDYLMDIIEHSFVLGPPVGDGFLALTIILSICIGLVIWRLKAR